MTPLRNRGWPRSGQTFHRRTSLGAVRPPTEARRTSGSRGPRSSSNMRLRAASTISIRSIGIRPTTTVRSSHGSRWTAGVLAAIALAAGGNRLSAHRLDEYLQAARLGIGTERVELELDLTPGSSVANVIIAGIDRNRDRR